LYENIHQFYNLLIGWKNSILNKTCQDNKLPTRIHIKLSILHELPISKFLMLSYILVI